MQSRVGDMRDGKVTQMDVGELTTEISSAGKLTGSCAEEIWNVKTTH